ncbi:MAG: hypothetical protein JKX90_07280 [Colwellia sp.]|nr:hypothetical protein [Colwellia sp.]
MKYFCSKLILILFSITFVTSCASTSTKKYACDVVQGADNNIEIRDGRDKHGDNSKSHKSNLLLDLSIGFISATGKAIKRAFTKEEKSKSEKCV